MTPAPAPSSADREDDLDGRIQDACANCEWHGEFQDEDKCPSCGMTGTMLRGLDWEIDQDANSAADRYAAFNLGVEVASKRTASSADRERGDEDVAAFGREVLGWMLDYTENFLEMAERYGYVERVAYDPEKHGDNIEAEPGQVFWHFTKKMAASARRTER